MLGEQPADGGSRKKEKPADGASRKKKEKKRTSQFWPALTMRAGVCWLVDGAGLVSVERATCRYMYMYMYMYM